MGISVRRLGYDVVLKAFPSYSPLLALIRDAHEKVAKSRSHRKDCDAIYRTVEGIEFNKIVALFREFLSSQPIMRGFAKSERRWKVFGVIGTIVDIAATTILGVWDLLK
jgi:hypothetical protein